MDSTIKYSHRINICFPELWIRKLVGMTIVQKQVPYFPVWAPALKGAQGSKKDIIKVCLLNNESRLSTGCQKSAETHQWLKLWAPGRSFGDIQYSLNIVNGKWKTNIALPILTDIFCLKPDSKRRTTHLKFDSAGIQTHEMWNMTDHACPWDAGPNHWAIRDFSLRIKVKTCRKAFTFIQLPFHL